MADLINEYIHFVITIFISRNASEFNNTIPLEPSHPIYQQLQSSLQSRPLGSLTIENVLSLCGALPEDTRNTFAAFLVDLLKYVRGESSDEESMAIGDFKRLREVQFNANRLYEMSSLSGTFLHAFMNPFIVTISKMLLQIGERAASLSTQPPRSSTSPRSIRDTIRQTIEKSFMISSSRATTEDWYADHTIGDNVWALSNILFRIYSQRKLHAQSVAQIRAIDKMNPPEEERLHKRGGYISQSDLSESYYWRGKIGVVLLDFRNAKRYLDQALDICPEDAYNQKRSILIRLIPVNLLLGILPTEEALHEYNLTIFQPLLHAFSTGNVVAWRRELGNNTEWFRARSIWLILFERGETLVWRNLFRNAWSQYMAVNPIAREKAQCPTWVLLQAMQVCFAGSGEIEDGSVRIEDVVDVLSTLIDHSLIRGYLSYSQQTLVLKKGGEGYEGFPKVVEVKPRAFATNA